MPFADALKQLAQLSPGIVAGLKGDGVAMKAFMDSYQQTTEQLDEQERRNALVSQQGASHELGMRERQIAIERQQGQDTRTAEDRQRRQALEGMAIPGQLAEMGSTAETPQDAQRLIESFMPQLMEAFGPNAMGYGQPAVEMATQTITGRQKAQMRSFVDAALKTSFVADNPDADPELIELPAHIVKIVGKPTAKLSELQKFAELPVGKPAAKKETPAPFNLSPGQTRYDGSGKPIASLPDRPEQPTGGGTDQQEWVVRNGEIVPIKKGTASPGDRPYNEVTQRKTDESEKRVESVATMAQDALTLVESLKTMPGLSGAVGARGPMSLFGFLDRPISGSEAAGYRANYDSLKSKITIPALQQMRGLGAMSDREFRTLSDSVTALSTEMPEAMFKVELDKLEQGLRAVVSRMQAQSASRDPKAAGAATAPTIGERRNVRGVLAEWDGKGWLPVVK